jgi:hypothetical protein
MAWEGGSTHYVAAPNIGFSLKIIERVYVVSARLYHVPETLGSNLAQDNELSWH